MTLQTLLRLGTIIVAGTISAVTKMSGDAYNAPMTIQHVRDAMPGCEPDCREWLAAEGSIGLETPALLQEVMTSTLRKGIPIVIHSPGGRVEAGMAMGHLLRAARMDVLVGKAVFAAPCSVGQPCREGRDTSSKRAVVEAQNAVCASACTLVLAAGAQRSVGPGASAGVHQVTVHLTDAELQSIWVILAAETDDLPALDRGGPLKISKAKRAELEDTLVKFEDQRIEAYLREMGMAPKMMQLMLATPSASLHMMTPTELQATNLATSQISPQQALYAANLVQVASSKPPIPPLNAVEIALIGSQAGISTAGQTLPPPAPRPQTSSSSREIGLAQVPAGRLDPVVAFQAPTPKVPAPTAAGMKLLRAVPAAVPGPAKLATVTAALLKSEELKSAKNKATAGLTPVGAGPHGIVAPK